MAGPEGDEHVIAERNENPVGRPVTLRPENVGPAFGPPLPILPGVRLIDRLSRGSAGLAENRNLIQRHAQRIPVWKGILSLDVAHHGFFDGGNAPDVVEGSDVVGRKAGRLIKRPMELRMGVSPAEYALELFQLKPPQLFPGQCFQNGVPVRLIVVHDRPSIRSIGGQ